MGGEFINSDDVSNYAEYRRRKKSHNIDRTVYREVINLHQNIVKLKLLKLKVFITVLL